MERKKLVSKTEKRKKTAGKRRKHRGNNFENEICREISLNWSKGTDDTIFIRTDNSGGRATSRKKTGKKIEFQSGDIGFNNPIGKPLIDRWNMEAKSGYQKTRKTKCGITKTNWGVLDLLDGSEKEPYFLLFWEQCYSEAADTDREPILFFRRNNRQSCIALRREYFEILTRFFGSSYNLFNYQIQLWIGIEEIVILNFKEFMKWANDLKGFVENYYGKM